MRIPIVNEKDEIIEYRERGDVPVDLIYRATGLWVTDKDGNILLAQRSFDKKNSPGLWGPAVAGTVEEGETYESNIVKEAEEEIGLVGVDFIIGPKLLKTLKKKYFVQWFVCVVDCDYKFKKDDVEVAEIKWFRKDDLVKMLEESPEIFLIDFKRYLELF